MDSKLIRILYENPETRARFFTFVDNVAIFDKIGFGWVINNRDFLKDSYTRYKKKIGLVDGNDNLISSSNDVQLVFPYAQMIADVAKTLK